MKRACLHNSRNIYRIFTDKKYLRIYIYKICFFIPLNGRRNILLIINRSLFDSPCRTTWEVVSSRGYLERVHFYDFLQKIFADKTNFRFPDSAPLRTCYLHGEFLLTDSADCYCRLYRIDIVIDETTHLTGWHVTIYLLLREGGSATNAGVLADI